MYPDTGGLRQKEAARQLDLSVRQIKRLVVRYRAEGAAGLVSRHRGRRPNNQIADALRQEILDLVRSRYADFGPTLACEKLAKLHDHKISVETLRQWMIADDLWKPAPRRFEWNSPGNLCQITRKIRNEEPEWTATRYCFLGWV